MPPSFERLRRERYTDDDLRQASTMRCFLDDPNSFQWPEGLCRTDPNDPTMCYFDSQDKDKLEPLFTWERRLNVAKKGNRMSFLEQRKFSDNCQKKTKFRRSFVVKGYSNADEVNEMLEAVNMKGLRHPHIAALLGTCSYPGNFWILSYPPGCCDLGDYMASISYELGGRSWRGKSWELLRQPYKGKEPQAHQIHHEYCWPFRESLGQKLARLRSYFFCLAQALHYLQIADVRHRDIKPDNVIIDLSGSVVVVDFGLAKKFPPNTSHQSQSETQRSFVVYQAPEVLNNKGRDDPSEIFSLGCIFLEMASLILGKNLERCEKTCRHVVNDTAWNWDFAQNLRGVAKWIEELKETKQVDSDDALAPSRSEMIGRLPTIELMLSEDPDRRPKGHGLWRSFDVPLEKRCRDCHPEHLDVWPPIKDLAHAARVAEVDRAKSCVGSQPGGSGLRNSKEFPMQAWKAVAGETPLRSGSSGPLFSSPLSSPRLDNFDPHAHSGGPVLVARPAEKLEQQGANEEKGKFWSSSEQNMHQGVTQAMRPHTFIGEENQVESGAEPGDSVVAGNHHQIESQESVVEYNEVHSLVSDEGYVVIDRVAGGSSRNEERRVRFDDAPASVIPSTTEVPENFPYSSLNGDVGQEVTSNGLMPEITPIPNTFPGELRRKSAHRSNEKILVYDEKKQELFSDTTNILRGNSHFY